MVKVKQFGPHGIASVIPSRSRYSRSRATLGYCIFYEDKNNYATFKFKNGSSYAGANGRGKMTLFNAGSNRFQVKFWDRANNLVQTIMSTTGMAGMPAKVDANATLSKFLTCSITGTIDAATTFSSGTAVTDATNFQGAS